MIENLICLLFTYLSAIVEHFPIIFFFKNGINLTQ